MAQEPKHSMSLLLLLPTQTNRRSFSEKTQAIHSSSSAITSLRVSAASMSAFAAQKFSPESFLDKRESVILHFVNYHGLGNDFVLVDNRDSSEPKITQEQAVKLCDRNFGVRADGLIFAMRPCEYSTQMVVNKRCVAMEFEALQDSLLRLRNYKGSIEIQGDGQVDMGDPFLIPEDVPTRLAGNKGESVLSTSS